MYAARTGTVQPYRRPLQINIQFRILLWLIISASLTMLQLVDLIVVSVHT